MLREAWPDLPPVHADFLENAVARLPSVRGLVGLAAGGSFVTGGMDEQSDLDFVLAFDAAAWPEVLDRRLEIAADLGALLAGFTGEHVGEPRLLICLYGPPLLHVDLKFVSLDDAHVRVEDPAILWERDGALSAAFGRDDARYPMPTSRWIEDRFWIWAHFLADKIERGELFHAIEMLTFLRARVLGPLELDRRGARPDGVRRIEVHAPEFAARLRHTVAGHDAGACLRALEATIALYCELRDGTLERDGAQARVSAVEREVRGHVANLAARLADQPS